MHTFFKAFAATITTTAVFSGMTNNLAFAGVEDLISAIEEKFKPGFAAIEEEGRRLAKDAPRPTELEATVGVNFDVEWEMTSIKFDIPEVKMKLREIKLHLPQVRMETTSINWDNPEFFMELRKIGEYPCFRSWKWYSCDIKTKMPEIRMIRREAKFDLPKFTWDITSIKLDIPEFFSRRVEIKLHAPQFKAKEVSAEIGEQKAAADALQQKAAGLAEEQKREINAAVSANLNSKRGEIAREFDTGIASLTESIGNLKASGVNTEAVPSPDGTVNLPALLLELQAKRAAALKELDAKIAEATTSG